MPLRFGEQRVLRSTTVTVQKELELYQVVLEDPDMRSPNGSKPMRRTYGYVATPEAAAAFGQAYAEKIHERNVESQEQCLEQFAAAEKAARSRSSSAAAIRSVARRTSRSTAKRGDPARQQMDRDSRSSRRGRRGRSRRVARRVSSRSNQITARLWLSASWATMRLEFLSQLCVGRAGGLTQHA